MGLCLCSAVCHDLTTLGGVTCLAFRLIEVSTYAGRPNYLLNILPNEK